MRRKNLQKRLRKQRFVHVESIFRCVSATFSSQGIVSKNVQNKLRDLEGQKWSDVKGNVIIQINGIIYNKTMNYQTNNIERINKEFPRYLFWNGTVQHEMRLMRYIKKLFLIDSKLQHSQWKRYERTRLIGLC